MGQRKLFELMKANPDVPVMFMTGDREPLDVWGWAVSAIGGCDVAEIAIIPTDDDESFTVYTRGEEPDEKIAEYAHANGREINWQKVILVTSDSWDDFEPFKKG